MTVRKPCADRIDILIDSADHINRNDITVAGTPFAGLTAEKFLRFGIRIALCVSEIIFDGIKKCAA